MIVQFALRGSFTQESHTATACTVFLAYVCVQEGDGFARAA